MSKKRTGLSDKDLEVIRAMAKHGMCLTDVGRELYCHRNTVVYHIGAIRRETGKDPMNFSDLIDLMREIGEMPGEHPVRGRWLPRIVLDWKTWECSECRTMGSPYWKRCPVCEAKMEVKDETD